MTRFKQTIRSAVIPTGRMPRLLPSVIWLLLLLLLVQLGVPVTVPPDSGDEGLLATLLQQASTIAELQARLDSQQEELRQQATTISKLQASMTAQYSSSLLQQSTAQNLVSNLSAQADIVAELNQSTHALQQQQSADLQALRTKITALETRQISLNDRVVKQEQTVAFYADFGLNRYTNITVASYREVMFNRVLLNIGDRYDIHSGIFTASSPGLYSFTVHFMSTQNSEITELGIFVQEEAKAIAYAEGGQRDSNDQGSCTAVVQLNAGDKVSVRLITGYPAIWGSRVSSFSGMLIHAV